MSDVPRDRCLQCGKSRRQARDPYDRICATATGYEVVEMLDEWDRHHWRDWSDTELAQVGILPEFYDEHRRDSWYDLPYAPCEHTSSGHRLPAEDVRIGGYLMWAKGQCVHCGRQREDTCDADA